jgi:hypothetical protein
MVSSPAHEGSVGSVARADRAGPERPSYLEDAEAERIAAAHA